MTDDEIKRLGDYCEGLLSQPGFQALVEYFNRHSVEEFFCSTPEQTQRREEAFNTYHGFKTFLGMMRTLIAQRDALNAPSEAPAEDALD